MDDTHLTPMSVIYGNALKTRTGIVRAPFGYPGSKFASANMIIPHLPYRNSYIEPFGGSGTILINRTPCKLECFNDRYAGVTAFYLCMQDKEMYQTLLAKIDNTIHSHEYWVWCKETWSKQTNIIDRAYRWFYMTQYSFGKLGRNFARTTKGRNGDSGKITYGIQGWQVIHTRLRRVCIENMDWTECINTYDYEDAVFYMDPPYLNTDPYVYESNFTLKDHMALCQRIFKMKGFVALSGYHIPDHPYDKFPWTKKLQWNSQFIMIQGLEDTPRETTECLWIKE